MHSPGSDNLCLLPQHSLYPPRLKQLSSPPQKLYYCGDLNLLQATGTWIGIVGTRRASEYGLRVCASLVAGLKSIGPIIVSGMAMGIDGMAHQAALDHGLKTVGVLGSSLDRIYPARNLWLRDRLLEKQGLLLTELEAGTEFRPWHFPKRNRLIAALSQILVVIEAPEKSGALITAHHALELGREIYVVPGPIDSPQHRGGHRLIQQGARLLMDFQDILQDLGWTPQAAPPSKPLPPLGTNEAKLLEIIGKIPHHLDNIVAISHLPLPLVTGLLMRLSLQGLIEELPGNRFVGKIPL
ncbi:MAG TPA: DNA-protecting protein DprA [Deltaproteobacteria bacterium]|nr:DNA-protecting protein DprA [Deltaproteobacteria bacterium]